MVARFERKGHSSVDVWLWELYFKPLSKKVTCKRMFARFARGKLLTDKSTLKE